MSLVENDSTALLVWHEWNSGHTSVQAVTGRNGAWGTPETIATDVDNNWAAGALGDDGTAAVGWMRTLHGNFVTQAVVRPPGGSWGRPSMLSFEDGQAWGPWLTVDGRGNVTAVSMTNVDFEATFLPAGSTEWQRPVAISEPTGGLGGAISLVGNRQGDTILTWTRPGAVMATVRRAGAMAWEPPVPISGDEGGYVYARTGLAVDAEGDAISAWQVADDRDVLGVRAAVLDVAPPHLDSLHIPARGHVRKPIVLSATFGDVSDTAMRWQLGDGVTRSGRKVVHAYRRPGTYSISVTATDAAGHSTFVARSVRITR